MLNDNDKWPITCKDCGHVTPLEIGHLRQADDFACSRCGHRFAFERQGFSNLIDNHKATVRMSTGNSSFLTEKRN